MVRRLFNGEARKILRETQRKLRGKRIPKTKKFKVTFRQTSRNKGRKKTIRFLTRATAQASAKLFRVANKRIKKKGLKFKNIKVSKIRS